MIASRLREASPEQVELMRENSEEIIVGAIEKARYAWTGFWNDEIACIVGVTSVTMLADTAYLWTVTTKVVEEHPLLFAKYSKMFVKDLLKQQYVSIQGCVDPKFEKSVRWLKWLGFKTVPLDGTDYYRFEMRRV